MSAPRLAELNQYVAVTAHTGPLEPAFCAQFGVVVLTGVPMAEVRSRGGRGGCRRGEGNGRGEEEREERGKRREMEPLEGQVCRDQANGRGGEVVQVVGEEEGECGVDKAVHRDRCEQMETEDFF